MKKFFYVLQKDNQIKMKLEPKMTFLDVKNILGDKAAICAQRNNELEPLTGEIKKGDVVTLLSGTHSESASRVYLRGATMLLHTAASELGIDVSVEHVLYGGVFCRVDDSGKNTGLIQKKIEEYIAKDEPFVFKMVDTNTAAELLAKEKMTEQVKLLKFRPYDYFRLYWFMGHCGYYHGIMPPSSGYLEGLCLEESDHGFIMKIKTPYESRHLDNTAKTLSVFKAAESWAKSMNCAFIADLNEHYLKGGIEDIIKSNERLHEKGIKETAKTIAANKALRVVLIAGPSSSGKTTFANRLAQELQKEGKLTLMISMDDYYKNRSDIAEDESGKKDFESLEAKDTQRLEKDITELLDGREVSLPVFDFVTGERKKAGIATKIKDELIIIEGIHGLNDKILTAIGNDKKFKIFISALTALNFDRRSAVLPEDLRLLRRLARDRRTRGFSFLDTFEMWDNVRKGEYKYILPYQERADVTFNSTLLYEPLVLKKYCYDELKSIPETDPGYIRAQSMLKFLNYFLSMQDESAIPAHSLLREFIGHK